MSIILEGLRALILVLGAPRSMFLGYVLFNIGSFITAVNSPFSRENIQVPSYPYWKVRDLYSKPIPSRVPEKELGPLRPRRETNAKLNHDI